MVVGGGPAGIAAALQAGRSGSSVVLVERGFQVGGNMTTGGVNFPGLFHAWGRQVIDGCAYEVLTKTFGWDRSARRSRCGRRGAFSEIT